MKTVFSKLFSSGKPAELPLAFQELLNRSGMEFNMPKAMKETEPHANCDYGMKVPGRKLELWYTIRPLDTSIGQFEAESKAGTAGMHPNDYYKLQMQAVLMNIAKQESPEYDEFQKAAVSKEFNADWGATCFVEAGEELTTEYKYCMMVGLHKNNLGDAYCFYLSDTSEGIQELMGIAFHALKFKP